MDAGMEVKLVDGCNCTICTCWIYYNGCDCLISRDCMLENLLLCITVRFNIRVLHVFNVEMMVMRNDRRRFQYSLVESLWLGVRAFWSGRISEWKGPRNRGRWLHDGRIFETEADFEKVECGGYGSGFMSSERRVVPRRPGEAGALGWIKRLVGVSGKALGSLDACHDRGRG